MVEYTYTAWGEVESITGTLASTIGQKNPLRYRGYYYDSETGFYFLKSRYYDPVVQRFLNADGYVTTGQGVLGNNMFAYCGNNPINFIDSFGTCYYSANGIWCHDSWEYLGGYVKKPDPKAIDITEQLNNAMRKHARELSNYLKKNNKIKAAIYFAKKSRSGGDWDLKSQPNWNLTPDNVYRYETTVLRFDDPGNIHYGYVGRFLFTESTLLFAGGMVQIYSRTSKLEYHSSNFDDPRDQAMISYGSILWDRGAIDE